MDLSEGFIAPPAPPVFSRFRYLRFWLGIPEKGPGSIWIHLMATRDAGHSKKLRSTRGIDLRGKQGWLEVKLDLKRDFSNTRNVKLEDVRYVQIVNLNAAKRTLYVDHIRLEPR